MSVNRIRIRPIWFGSLVRVKYAPEKTKDHETDVKAREFGIVGPREYPKQTIAEWKFKGSNQDPWISGEKLTQENSDQLESNLK